MELTPFSVDGSQVEALGAAFTSFANRLLHAERASLGVSGHALTITTRENDPDGGIDAEFHESPGSAWVPSGSSAWQFKRSDIPPRDCRAEVQKLEVQKFLEKGGAYCLAIGEDITSLKVRNREEALREAAPAGSEVRVYNASALADWASEHPSVLTLPALRANTGPLIRFEEWSSRSVHTGQWIPDEVREGILDAVREELLSGARVLRFEGGGGVGKTRLALEILRSDQLSPIAGYIDDAAGLDASVFNDIQRTGRRCVIVVDECDRRTHQLLADRLDNGGQLALLTIGQEAELEGWAPAFFEVPSMDQDNLRTVVAANYPAIPDTHREFVAENSGGSVRLALELAKRLSGLSEADASDIIGGGDIEAVLRLTLPTGAPFAVASALAMLRRVGWEDGKEADLQAISAYLGLTPSQVMLHSEELARTGVLARQGRYRYITPRPLAVVLAARRWRTDPDGIVQGLLPALSGEGQDALVARAADLGRHPDASSALADLLSSDGPFGSLEALEVERRARFLSYLAVISPGRTIEHLESITNRPSEELRTFRGSRRELVWAVEKLAWHSSTFRVAADILLRLSLAENESYSNNATGTWVGLFGARLPSTAASPHERAEYVRTVARSDDTAKQLLAVKAAARGLNLREVRTVSAELQYGRAVEPPGAPRDSIEDISYRSSMLDVLAELARSSHDEVRDRAIEAFLENLGQYIGTALEEDVIRRAVATLPRASLHRKALELKRWHEGRDDEEPTALRMLVAETESTNVLEGFKDLVSMPPWHLRDEDKKHEIAALLERIEDEGALAEAISWLASQQAKSAWLVGHALASRDSWADYLQRLLEAEPTPPTEALRGFIEGIAEARSDYLHDALDAIEVKVSTSEFLGMLAIAGQHGIRRLTKAYRDSGTAPRQLSALLLHRAMRTAVPSEARELVSAVVESAVTPEDWTVALEAVLAPRPRELSVEQLSLPDAWKVLEDVPVEAFSLGNTRWEWFELARLLVARDPLRVLRAILSRVRDGLLLSGDDDEAETFIEASRHDPDGALAEIMTEVEGPQGYRLSISGRGWILRGIPLGSIASWIDGDPERARAVAQLAEPGTDSPTPTARYLLLHYAPDDQIENALAMQYLSGTWWGPESARIESQLSALDKWQGEEALVRRWAVSLQDHLRERLREARQREEEERW